MSPKRVRVLFGHRYAAAPSLVRINGRDCTSIIEKQKFVCIPLKFDKEGKI